MYHHVKKLMFTVRVDEPDPRFGNMLLEQFGGANGELAAAMPGTGGTYLYLREAFRKTRLGGILPFLFIWQFIFSGPLESALTGVDSDGANAASSISFVSTCASASM